MIFEYSPIIGSGTINGVGPTTVLINPSAINVPYGIITKIEYLIFDSQHVLIDTITVNRRLGTDALSGDLVEQQFELDGTTDIVTLYNGDIISFPEYVGYTFQTDLGDPRNVIVPYTFYPAQFEDIVNYYVRINVTYSTSTAIVTVEEIDVNIEQANLLGPTDVFANKVHLVANRMWGHSNQKMFALETTGPRSIYFVKPLL